MIRNYFKTALRSFKRHTLFGIINVVGLSIGVTAALVIGLIIHYDFTFDRFHSGEKNIYRIVTNYSYQGLPAYNPGVCGPMVGAVKAEVAGIDEAAPFLLLSQPTVFIPAAKGNDSKFKLQNNVVLADEHYFRIFQYRWLAGSANATLSQPYQTVLTSDQARLYFPSLTYNQMLGRIVIYDTIRTTVTGIVESIRENTDLRFHDFISFSTALAVADLKSQLRLHNWGGTNFNLQLFVKLSPKTSPALVERQIDNILVKNEPPNGQTKGNTHNFRLQPLSEIHFNEHYGTFFNGRVANKTSLYELLAIAVFLLLLGCINYINLSTAQSVQRAKEIGIRKTLGSSRSQLIGQFLTETFLVTLIAVILSAFTAQYVLKLFGGFIPEGLKADLIHQPVMLLFLAALTVVVSFSSGFYPALVLSAYKPIAVLKNQALAEKGSSRNAMLRKSLTVTQFVIAQFFIMATIFVSKQIYYAMHIDPGFKKEAIVTVNTPEKNRRLTRNTVFVNRLRAIPQVELVSVGRDAPGSDNTFSTEATYKDGKKEIKVEDLAVKFGDENYIELYQIKLLAGRNLQAGDKDNVFLINNTFARRIGFTNPQDAVGKQIDNYNGDTKMTIIGVVSDFHQESIQAAIAPLAIITSTDPGNTGTFHIALKPQTTNGNEWGGALAGMKRIWEEVYPDDDFEYHFVDENLARLYTSEKNESVLLGWATGLSITIGCLGLLGLAIYTNNLRRKEIGVRKVLGASVAQVVLLLSREMVLLILLAFIIVTPVAWWTMNKWVENYADHTGISWWIFALSALGMLVVAFITSGYQTLKAAMANPSENLRTE
jgi:putative ABC transport system permease protein